MKGAIAAGHPLTARAGADVLAAGGNAVDACVAAALVSWVVESPLTGPGGGGFLLVHRARDRTTRVLDFFVAAPKPDARAQMDSIHVDFSGGSSQEFHVGGASCAVPGSAAGLEEAHRTYGSLPWQSLFEPALALARGGVTLTRQQAYLHTILDSILRSTEEARAVYGPDGRALETGDRLVMADLAGTLELFAERGAAALYGGTLGRRLAEHVHGSGGSVSASDLARYRPVWRRPVRTSFAGHEFLSNPPPSSGGILIAYGLALLDRLGISGAGSLIEVMHEQSRARNTPGFTSELRRGGLARRLFAEEALAAALERIHASTPETLETAGVSGTTHISVIDARGDAASLSASLGSGSGVVVPGAGIHLNNMLGEADLNPVRATSPGARLTSMMAPSLVLAGGRPRLVVGSAGSARLRGAILQVVVNVLVRALDVRQAIEAPRVHAEGEAVHCEGGFDAVEARRLQGLGYAVVRWKRRNLFFGGVAAVEALADGSLAAARDSRRGGAGIVV
jgi:gamma-glutamyltranspeptidase/glutathione hydrolase